MAARSASGIFDWHLDGLTAGEVAERMRVAASAVRYYADQGLLPHRRTPTNERRFHVDVLCRVAMIQVAQRVGMSLAEIRDALTELPPGQAPTPEDWQRLSMRLKQTLHGRIDEMFTLLDELANDLGAPVTTRHERTPESHVSADQALGPGLTNPSR
jgi:MerR family redox-sensitive transcriptional activator SoxR